MEWSLALAALLAVGIAVAHAYLGERYILIRLFRRNDFPRIRGSEAFTKQILRFAWHVTSVAWIAMGVALLSPCDSGGARRPHRTP